MRDDSATMERMTVRDLTELLDALAEALDGWQAASFRSKMAGGSGTQEAKPRCDELRAKFLEGK